MSLAVLWESPQVHIGETTGLHRLEPGLTLGPEAHRRIPSPTRDKGEKAAEELEGG